MFLILMLSLFSSSARAADPFFIELGIVTLSDKTPEVALPLKIKTQWMNGYILPEIIFVRMDVKDVENELSPMDSKQNSPSLCFQTVRLLQPDGYLGLNSITYGGRIRASGDRIVIKAIKTCGKKIKYKVRAVSYWNADHRKEDFPTDVICTKPDVEGWCNK